MPQPYALLIAGFDYSTIAEEEFHAWYDTEHIPERMAVKGFINAQRWIGVDDPKFALATYDLESLRVLDDPAYKIRKAEGRSPWSRRIARKTKLLVRVVAEQLPPGQVASPDEAEGLLVVGLNVKPEADADFQAWYDEEHVPALSKVPGTLCARRFKTTEGEPSYIAVYHLANPEVQASAAWKAAVDTPWTARIRPQTFGRMRYVLRRYHPAKQ